MSIDESVYNFLAKFGDPRGKEKNGCLSVISMAVEAWEILWLCSSLALYPTPLLKKKSCSSALFSKDANPRHLSFNVCSIMVLTQQGLIRNGQVLSCFVPCSTERIQDISPAVDCVTVIAILELESDKTWDASLTSSCVHNSLELRSRFR